jgi:uncharacterized membrane protein YqjE
VAAILRLYRIDTTEFDSDQADIFRMAYDAAHQHLLIATSNVASLHIYNPPGIIYLLLLTASWSADPLWAAVMVALLAVASVVLTYVLVRLYYGRLAAILTSLLYATAALPVFYSRFIWQQNLLLFFVPVFILVLFRGTVTHRRGWLAPALVLLGLLVQLHASTVMLVAPLVVAWLVAPQTVRWRDVLLGVVALLVIYAPYVVWELATNFQDVLVLFAGTGQHAKLDTQALQLYQQFLGPYSVPSSANSLFSSVAPFVSWLLYTMTALLIVAGIMVLVLLVLPMKQRLEESQEHGRLPRYLRGTWNWWRIFRAQPYRCGLLILLVWQAIPLIYLSRHTINLQPHYFIMFMPGPFILIGILLANSIAWLRRPGRLVARVGSIVIALLAVVLICAQFVASGASVLDKAYGNFVDTNLSYPYYNDLASMQHVLHTTDHIAQQQHLQHIYVATDSGSEMAFQYLTQFTRVPTTAFSENCMILPDPTIGPALLVLGPHSDVAATFLPRYATVTPVGSSPRLGGAPYRLYRVQTNQTPPLGRRMATSSELQLLNVQHASYSHSAWILSRWNIGRSAAPTFRTTYVYNFVNLNAPQLTTGVQSPDDQGHCVFTALHAGDQVVVNYRLPYADASGASIPMRIEAYTTMPLILKPAFLRPLGLTFETDAYVNTSAHIFHMQLSSDNFQLPTS